MKTINLTQGSEKWHAHRFVMHNASEAAAMLGIDPLTTRTQLLDAKSTGQEKEFSAWVQEHVLDHGHEVEKKVIPIIEERFGLDLYPLVGTTGKMSASYDGITLDSVVICEVKQWNKKLAESVRNGNIPDSRMPQLQQQLMIATAKVNKFVVSDGTEDNMEIIDVLPDIEWFKRIKNGWEQFDKDLAAHVPKVITGKPVPNTFIKLPTLSVQIIGEVISSNLPAFKIRADAYFQNVNKTLKTDQDFVNAINTVKYLKEVETGLEEVKKSALSQTASVDEFFQTIYFYKEGAREIRLILDRLIKIEKEKIKINLIQLSNSAFSTHLDMINKEFTPVTITTENPNFALVMKNKSTIDSLGNAVDTELARCKILANEAATNTREKLAWFNANVGVHCLIFADLQALMSKEFSDFKLNINSRIEEAVKKAAQLKIEEDEKAKKKDIPYSSSVAAGYTKCTATLSQPVTDNESFKVADHIAEVNDMVTVHSSVFKSLQQESDFLSCLRELGLNKWPKYKNALDLYKTRSVKK